MSKPTARRSRPAEAGPSASGAAEPTTREVGRARESLAATHLEAAGLEILDRNVELAGAEVDLVAREPEGNAWIYVFVEVRSRADAEHGSPLETIGPRKRARIVRAATAWLVRADLWERVPVRFDVIAVTGGELEWLRGAFEVDGR